MANLENLKESLLPESSFPSNDNHQKSTFKRRRFRRYWSSPLVDDAPEEENVRANDTQTSNFLIRNLHPSLREVTAFLLIYLGIGAICFYAFQNQISGKKTNSIVDALYFGMVTMTTVGYGDLVPKSATAKLFACAFVFSGIAFVSLILSRAADYFVEQQQALIIRALKTRKKSDAIDFMKEIEAKKNKHKCVLVLIFLLILIVSGTIFMILVEKMDFVDAFYCVCTTITTLGYGDYSFSTKRGRMFAVLWILTSTVCLAQFFLYAAELHTERRQNALVKYVFSRPMTDEDLEAADLDGDGVVVVAEFVLYKLKQMGKITQNDISIVMKEYGALDVNRSGTLSSSEITASN